MNFALGSSTDSSFQLLCSKKLNNLESCFGCIALSNLAPKNFTAARDANAGFLFFSAVNVALQQAGDTKLGIWPMLANFTNLVTELISRFD